MKIQKIAGVLVMLCCVLALTGCRVGNTEFVLGTQNLNTPKFVFQVDERTCDLKQAKLYLCNYRNLYGSAYGMNLWEYDYGADSLEKYVKDITIKELSAIMCMDLLAGQMEIALDEDELAYACDAGSEYYASLTAEEQEYIGVKEADVQKMYEDYALANKLYQILTAGIDEEVSDDEARVIRVQRIYVQDEETALTVQEKLEEGDDFAAVAGTYNQASGIEVTMARDDYPQEVENIAFNLDNSQVSEMVKAKDGYYFIKCLSKLEKELTEENKETIRNRRRKAQFDDVYQNFADTVGFTMNDELWGEVTLENTDFITTDSFFEIYFKHFGG